MNLINFSIQSYEDIAAIAAMTHEDAMRLDWMRCSLAVIAEDMNARGDMADLWFCSHNTVAKYARRGRAFPEEWRLCDIPRNLPDAAIVCADEHRDSAKPWRRDAWRWLRVAWRCKLSARQLKDKADVGHGRKVSRVALANHEGEPTEWREGHMALDVPDWIPSGEPPERVKVRVVEVLA